MSAENRARLGPALSAMLADTGAVGIEAYLDARDRIHALASALAAFHDRYDLLITPTVAAPAFEAERTFPPAFENMDTGDSRLADKLTRQSISFVAFYTDMPIQLKSMPS